MDVFMWCLIPHSYTSQQIFFGKCDCYWWGIEWIKGWGVTLSKVWNWVYTVQVVSDIISSSFLSFIHSRSAASLRQRCTWPYSPWSWTSQRWCTCSGLIPVSAFSCYSVASCLVTSTMCVDLCVTGWPQMPTLWTPSFMGASASWQLAVEVPSAPERLMYLYKASVSAFVQLFHGSCI